MKPTAWYDPTNGMVSTDNDCPLFTPLGQIWALYPKQEWVGLTDEEIRDLWSWSMTREAELTATTQQHAFARAIEQALKERNT